MSLTVALAGYGRGSFKDRPPRLAAVDLFSRYSYLSGSTAVDRLRRALTSRFRLTLSSAASSMSSR